MPCECVFAFWVRDDLKSKAQTQMIKSFRLGVRCEEVRGQARVSFNEWGAEPTYVGFSASENEKGRLSVHTMRRNGHHLIDVVISTRLLVHSYW